MSKLDFSVVIENDESINHMNVKAQLTEDEIKYKESDGTNTIFNYKNKLLIRENKELKMTYRFLENSKTEGTIEVKELQKEIKVAIDTKEITIENHNINIIFDIEENHFIYRIEEII